MVKELIQPAFNEFGLDSFVGVRQATLYAIMYYGMARFEELKEL